MMYKFGSIGKFWEQEKWKLDMTNYLTKMKFRCITSKNLP